MSAAERGFSAVAETEQHEAVWVAWPYQDWGAHLQPARAELRAMCAAIADAGPDGRARGERVRLLVADAGAEAEACSFFEGVPVEPCRLPYGDVWTRDTGPIFVRGRRGTIAAATFDWDGWGGKYVYEHDDGVAAAIARTTAAERLHESFVLEGGAIEVDGEGTLLTTRQCVLSETRNPGITEASAEAVLKQSLGVRRVLWLDQGLAHDHTDGHVDTLARFVSPGVVVCMRPEPDDPNREVLEAIAAALRSFTDAEGRTLRVEQIPSPGRIAHPEEGWPMPASYVNYYVGNRVVVVPAYGSPHDDDAVHRLATLYPDRRVVGRSARALLTGGGAFHCTTREQPVGGTERDG